MRINGTSVEVVRGSVLEQEVDAIVNAANTKMRGGGGVDGAIHMAAGPELIEELRRVAPRGASTSEVVVTRGHSLPQPWIFHVAGPIYRYSSPDEAKRLLEMCYVNCLEEAARRNLESIAFPSISTGAYGYPLEEAAPVALRAVGKYLRQGSTSLQRVAFAMFGQAEFDAFSRELQSLESEPEADGAMQSWSSGA